LSAAHVLFGGEQQDIVGGEPPLVVITLKGKSYRLRERGPGVVPALFGCLNRCTFRLPLTGRARTNPQRDPRSAGRGSPDRR